MKHCYLLLSVCFISFSLSAQYAPQVGLPGTTAVSASSSLIQGWANGCTVQRGYMDIAQPALGVASLGTDINGTGPADNQLVSLGDSGVAVLTFPTPIYNGPGADFAVFENGFINAVNDSEAFLELAFVEVSSDGINYYRFPDQSLTPDDIQISNATYINASRLNNLAGKYIGGYGTPFDLDELAGSAGLDVNNITHVRLIDVVGSIGAHGSVDFMNRKINDPYPTPFASSGFDLDAVGVLHLTGFTSVASSSLPLSVKTYPNPTTDKLSITVADTNPGYQVSLTDMTGRVLQQQSLLQNNNVLSLSSYRNGMYYLVLTDANGNRWVEKITKL